MEKITTIADAQALVKNFAEQNGWIDEPNIDKFDHVHEELIEMSRHLRYKTADEMKEYIAAHRDTFEDGIGDVFFALCRLANQLGIDIEDSFALVSNRIREKYAGKKEEKPGAV